MSKIHALQFYIDGAWVAPVAPRAMDVINPATEGVIGQVSIGSVADVDLAVKAARAAFPAFSATSREERLALLSRIVDIYKRRFNEMGATISEEMGAPLAFATKFQAGAGMGHFRTALDILKTFAFEEQMGTTQVVREPIGVAGMITPWNWPANQIACKIAPALATGCTMVLKPSEVAPYSALAAGRNPGRSRCAEGCVQPRQRRWAGRRRRYRRTSGHRRDLVYWLDQGRYRRCHQGGIRPSSVSVRNWAASRPTSSSTTPILPAL